MNAIELAKLGGCGLLLLVFLSACGRDTRGEVGENVVKVCGFKENHGVFLSDETRQALRLATTEATTRRISRTVRGTAQVFAPGKATMLVDTNSGVKVGQRVLLENAQEGRVVAVENVSTAVGGSLEAIIGLPPELLKVGAHLHATLLIEPAQELPAVPESSLLDAATGTFVFVANGQHFLRTPVRVAGKADGWAAVSNGLLEGDVVVTNGVEGLWRIELQATKGGHACCAVPKKE